MLRFFYMKDLVLLPLKFVAILVVLLSLCAGFQVIVDYTLLAKNLHPQFPTLISGIVFKTLLVWFFPVLGLTTLLMLSSILQRKRYRWIMLILLFVFLAGTIFGGFFLVNRSAALVKQTSKHFDFNVPEKTILPFNQGYFYAFHDQPLKIQGLMFHSNDFNSQFEIIPDAVKNADSRHLLIGEHGVAVPVKDIMSIRADPLAVPPYMMGTINLISNASSFIFNSRGSGLLTNVIIAGSLAFALIGLWFFVRITRWPLFNIMIAISALLGILLYATVLANPVVASLFAFVPDSYKIYILPSLYGISGLFMLGCGLFLPSLAKIESGEAE